MAILNEFLGQKEKLKVVERLHNTSIINLENVTKKSEKITEEIKRDENILECREKDLERLKEIIELKKEIIANNNEMHDCLKKLIREYDLETDAASRRMSLLSFEYFDVAKKLKNDREKSNAIKF